MTEVTERVLFRLRLPGQAKTRHLVISLYITVRGASPTRLKNLTIVMKLPSSTHFAHVGIASNRGSRLLCNVARRKTQAVMKKAASRLEKIESNPDATEAHKIKQRVVLMKRVKKKVASIESILIFPSVAPSAQRCVEELAGKALHKLLRGCIDMAVVRRRRGISSADVTYVANALNMPGSFDGNVTDELSLLPNGAMTRGKRSAQAKGGVKGSVATAAEAEADPEPAVSATKQDEREANRSDDAEQEEEEDEEKGDPDATDDE